MQNNWKGRRRYSRLGIAAYGSAFDICGMSRAFRSIAMLP